MGIFTKRRPEPPPIRPSIGLAELLEKHDVISAEDGVLIVTPHNNPRQFSASTPNYRELGVAGTASWLSSATEDYNPALRGQQGLRKFDEMRRQDGQVAMALLVRKTPVLGARWYIDPPSSKDATVRAKKLGTKMSEHLWNNLTRWSTVSWPLLLQESLLHLDFGWYAFEKTHQKVDGLVRWRKFAPRHPLDCTGWVYDANGGPRGAKFPGPNASGLPVDKLIPIDKLVVFTHAKEGGNMEGISVLRPIYKHWYIKDTLYKIDAIQKERHGVGVPVIVLPPNYSQDDKVLAEQMGRNLRTNEKAYIVLPPNWEINMLELQGQNVDVIKSAEHHNTMIEASVLARFTGDAGNTSIEAMMDLFMKATRIDADVVRDVFNKWAIPEVVRWNWGKTASEEPPELKVRRIGEMADWRTLTFALRNLVGANLLIPDKPLLENMRTEFDLPLADPASAIPVATPQMPGSAGPPRQSTAGNTSGGTGKSNAGEDRSGSSGTN